MAQHTSQSKGPRVEWGNVRVDSESAFQLSFRGESDYSDSSRPIYNMYSKIAEKEDNTMVKYYQKNTDGTLVYSGLFSATVATLLTVTIPDLKPNPQDTSAFYLENIYQLFGNSNVSDPSIQSALAKPPAFSPPSYAIWVNSLWFLSLLASLWGATVATLFRNWATQYIAFTQPPRYKSEKQARIREIFSEGNPGPYMKWAGQDTDFLHLALLLFITGSLIYLFNINRTVFYAVVWSVGYMTMSYAGVTVTGAFVPHDLFYTPLSRLVLRIYLGISYVAFQVCSYTSFLDLRYITTTHYRALSNRYRKGFLKGKRREAKEIASKKSAEIDARILERILSNLEGDHTLEAFFDAIPGFCSSNMRGFDFSFRFQGKLGQALDGFLNRTFSSSLISESVRTGRLITCLNVAHAALGSDAVSRILGDIIHGRWIEALQSVKMGHSLRRWGTSSNKLFTEDVRRVITEIIISVREHDDHWISLVKAEFSTQDHALDHVPHGDVLLSILIRTAHQINQADSCNPRVLSALSEVDIRNTRPELQHEFCASWNEISKAARIQGSYSIPTQILCEIRHLYVALHQGADAAPTAHFHFTNPFDPLSYPLCHTASHHPDSTAHVPAPNSLTVLPTQLNDLPSPPRSTSGGNIVLRQVKEAISIVGPPFPSDSMTPSAIRDSSQPHAATSPALPVYTNPHSTDASPPGAVAATLSHPLESSVQRDIVAQHTEPDINENLFTTSTPSISPTLAPVPTSPPVPSTLLSWDTGVPSTSNPSLPAPSVVGLSIPASLPPSRAPLFPNPECLALSNTTPPHPKGNAAVSRLQARVLVSTESMSFVNAALQLLVHSPPFWNLFWDLGDLKRKRGEGGLETGGGATPLVDATVKFLEEFVFKEKEPPAQQPSQQDARVKPREDEEAKNDDAVDSFEPMYMYNAMKEKQQLRNLLDGKHQNAEEFLALYLDALDEELVQLHTFNISTRKLVSTPSAGGIEEEAQPTEGQTEVDYSESSFESPISRIFSGRFRSTISTPSLLDIVTIEAWRSLQLNIQPDSVYTIQDAIAQVVQPQPVQVGQPSSSESSRQLHIEVLPSVLVLHLNRFSYDAAADGIVKISKFVHFAPELEIPPEMMVPVGEKSAEPVNYKLYGVLYHHGESTSSAHYTVDMLHPNGDAGGGESWLHIDDEAVSAVQHEDMFGVHNNERSDDRCAYMLFYCRTSSTET